MLQWTLLGLQCDLVLKSVDIVYRRRKADMTALRGEIEGAEAEGCSVVELMSPKRIEMDENNKC